MPPCRQALVVSRQARFANIGPHGVNRARRRDADLARKGRTAIAVAPHAAVPVIDKSTRDAIEIGVGFQ
jgi:hypothetical protein